MRLHLVVDLVPDLIGSHEHAIEDLVDGISHDEAIHITTATNVYVASVVSVQERGLKQA